MNAAPAEYIHGMAKKVWVVRAGRGGVFVSEFLSHKIVGIGWSELGDLTNVHGRAQISALMEEKIPASSKIERAVASGQVYRFRDELVQNETVLTYDPSERNYWAGTVIGEYRYRPDLHEELRHTRGVNWIRRVGRDLLSPATKNSLGAISTIFCVSEEASEEILAVASGEAVIESAPDSPTSEIVHEEETEVRKDTEQRAMLFLQDKLSRLDWEEMQELVAGLLRAMGYKTRVALPGADRGRDILASPDGFGFQSPRILVEVKHRKGAMGAPEVRKFVGGLRQGDHGLYVSTGGFSREALYEAERSNIPLMLMDADDLGKAIVDHYDQMDMETRSLLPMRKIYWPD
jgi:restriction system protein